jgi:hypothetical protein
MAQVGIVRVKKLLDALLAYIKEEYELNTGLQATVVLTTANATGVKQKYTVTFTGTQGKGMLTGVGSLSKLVTYGTSLDITLSTFVTANLASYATAGVTITSLTNKLYFESTVAGVAIVLPVFTDRESESFLYRCFDADDIIDNISYRDLAVEIFTRETTDHRKVETRLLFDVDRAALPTIHVREPAKGKGKEDGIGNIAEEFYENVDGGYSEIRRRSFDSQFELMITSMNRHEVIIMEEVVLALLIGGQDSFMLQAPFYNVTLTVKELMTNNELVPTPLFIKSIGMNVSYDKKYPDISNDEILHRILFEHVPEEP